MRAGKTPEVEDRFSGLLTPNIEDMRLQLEELVSQGTLSPEEAQIILQDPSAMESIQTDPMMKQAQMEALNELRGIGQSGGLNAQSKSRLARIAMDEDSQAKGRNDAIMSNMQSRGISGSGLEMANRMQNQQNAASNKSMRDMDVAALAEQQALQAIMQSGQLGGQMQQQDFNQQSQVANAQDAISRFNSQNRQQQNNLNVANRNNAQSANLVNAQNLSNQNVGTRNQEQIGNKNLLQQEFNNQVTRRGGQQQNANLNAQIAGQNSAGSANAQNQTIGTLATIGGGIMGGPMGAAAGQQLSGAVAPTNQQYSGQLQDPQWGKKDRLQMKDGGLVHGENTGVDSEARLLMPGEMVVKKDDVPNIMESMHKDENGNFDVSGFLDQITGYKYGYKKGKK